MRRPPPAVAAAFSASWRCVIVVRNIVKACGYGGDQEREKATSIIKEVFPNASVTAEANYNSSVTISETGTKQNIITVPQRDLYRKYRWPAEPKVKEMLEIFKEEYEK